ncbi:MAG: protein phosphatase 2C domain-containing protein [Selenomonadaceae bacterium]|nr:protein phosphatase 2C domain-containing protein [Selenomonadaceae bacterium]
MNIKFFHKTVQGASHKKKNKICQDASTCGEVEIEGKKAYFSVVCDGHGGNDYMRSNIGSELGVKVASEYIVKFIQKATKNMLNNDQHYGRQLRYLSEMILKNWREAVKNHLDENPFTEEEFLNISEKAKKRYTMLEQERFYSAYGTTMIAVGYTEDYAFALHLGDGKCISVDKEGNFEQLVPWDENCFLNATTSMCDSDAINEFRCHYFKEPPAVIFIASDGVDDCFANNEKMYHFYKTLLFSISKDGFDDSVKELEEYLPRMSAKGSGDDISIGAIIDMDIVEGLDSIKNFDPSAKKAPEKKEEKNSEPAVAEEKTEPETADKAGVAEVKPEETKPEPQKEEAVETPVEGKKVPTKGLEEDFQPIKMNNSVPHRYPMNEPVVIQPPAPADFETKKETEKQ